MSVLKDLLTEAIKKDSRWYPKIYTDMSPPYFLPSASDGNKDNPKTDIVAYLSKPDTLQECQLLSLNYPSGCVYRFDRFKGQSNKDSLCKYLCEQDILSSATTLVLGSMKKNTSEALLESIRLQCQHYRKTEASRRDFNETKFQQPGTYEQQENKSSSVRGKSSSSTKTITPLLDGSFPYLRFYKETSHRPLSDNHRCGFALHLICSAVDEHWYLRHNACRGIKSKVFHEGHLPINPSDVESDMSKMPTSAKKFIDNCLHSRVPIPQIVQLLLREYGLTVSENTLYNERNKILYPLFSNGEGNICGTEVDQLLKEFEQKNDVSYIYVLHKKILVF